MNPKFYPEPSRPRSHSKGDGARGDLSAKGDRSGGTERADQQRPEIGSTWRVIRELAGELGLAPGPFSLRELNMMAEGKRKQEWHRVAVSTCLIANTWRGKSGTLKVSDFPYCHQQKNIRMATHAECKAFAENFFR